MSPNQILRILCLVSGIMGLSMLGFQFAPYLGVKPVFLLALSSILLGSGLWMLGRKTGRLDCIGLNANATLLELDVVYDVRWLEVNPWWKTNNEPSEYWPQIYLDGSWRTFNHQDFPERATRVMLERTGDGRLIVTERSNPKEKKSNLRELGLMR